MVLTAKAEDVVASWEVGGDVDLKPQISHTNVPNSNQHPINRHEVEHPTRCVL